MAQFDLKRLSAGALIHKYRGVIGSIRSIDTHPTLPLIASASIDQYIRIHDAETYRPLTKVRSRSSLASCAQNAFFLVLHEISFDIGALLVPFDIESGGRAASRAGSRRRASRRRTRTRSR